MTASKDGQLVAASIGYSHLDGIEFVCKILVLQRENGKEG